MGIRFEIQQVGQRTKVLFAGDLIFAGQIPFAGDDTCNPEQWIATLKTWLSWEILRVIPGHGPVAGMAEIKKHLDFFESLKKATLDAIQAGQEPQDIKMPAIYTVSEKEQWLVEKTKKHWFEFYKTVQKTTFSERHPERVKNRLENACAFVSNQS